MGVIPDVDKLTEQVKVLNEGLGKLESQVTYLISVMSSMERQTSGLNENVGSLTSNAGNLSGNVESLNETLNTLGQVVASLSLIIFQINKVLDMVQLPLKLLSNASTAITGGIDVLFESAKTVVGRTEKLANTVESIALPLTGFISDDEEETEE